MSLIDPYEVQKIHISRQPWSNEERDRRNKELIRQAVDEHITGAGVTIKIIDPEGGSNTYYEGDPIRRGADVRSSADFESMKRKRDVLTVSRSQILINTNDPAARYVVNPQGTSIVVADGIFVPEQVINEQNCHTPPDPAVRQKVRGGWIEVGELHPGIDGAELLAQLVARGAVIDRKLVDKVLTAAKKTLSKSSKAE